MVSGVSVVTTTWNEKENIEQLVCEVQAALRGVVHEVVVVDDSSTDGTLQVAKRVADVAVGKPRQGQSTNRWTSIGRLLILILRMSIFVQN